MNIFVFGSMVGGILLLDLFLSGDNVLIIGAAAAGLQRHQRWYAIAMGGLLAMIFRILMTMLASFLLNIPFIQTLGAIILLYLAQKLLKEHIAANPQQANQPTEHFKGENGTSIHLNNTFLSALVTILIADITMSLDNVIAVGALSNGEILPMVIGLIGSITVLMLGSAIVSILIERLRWILDIAAFALAWTSASMIHDDIISFATTHPLTWLLNLDQHTLVFHLSWFQIILFILTSSLIIFFDLFYRNQQQKRTARCE